MRTITPQRNDACTVRSKEWLRHVREPIKVDAKQLRVAVG